LSRTYELWQEIKKYLSEEYGELTEDWKFYGQKYGWQLKTLKKKRNLFFFIPVKDFFKLSFKNCDIRVICYSYLCWVGGSNLTTQRFDNLTDPKDLSHYLPGELNEKNFFGILFRKNLTPDFIIS